MSATSTIKIFGLREYSKIALPVEVLPDIMAALTARLRESGKQDTPIKTACLYIIHDSLLKNDGSAQGFTDEQDTVNIAKTVFLFASLSGDPKFDPVNGNFILVEATLRSFACTIYGHDQKPSFRHDLFKAREHFAQFGGMVEPNGRRHASSGEANSPSADQTIP